MSSNLSLSEFANVIYILILIYKLHIKDSKYTGQECHANSLYQDFLVRHSQYGRMVAPIPCHPFAGGVPSEFHQV